MSVYKSLFIKKISLIGEERKPASIEFNKKIKFVTGASNTGKSFLLSIIDFMLGKEKAKENKNIDGYKTCIMQFYIGNEKYTSFRNLSSDRFFIYDGFIYKKDKNLFIEECKTGQSQKKVKNISYFMFSKMGLEPIYICTNKSASKESLTLRTLSKVFIAHEMEMIDDLSPVLTADRGEKTTYKNIFNYIISGNDCKRFETIPKTTDFRNEKQGKITAFQELIDDLKSDLSFPDEKYDEINKRKEKIESSIFIEKEKLNSVTKSLNSVLENRKSIMRDLEKVTYKIRNNNVNILNFKSLSDLYLQDIERLQSQEESAFLLKNTSQGFCKLCGKENSDIDGFLVYLEDLSSASLVEIKKIENKRNELIYAIESAEVKKSLLDSMDIDLSSKLQKLDREVEESTPNLIDINNSIDEKNVMLAKIKREINLVDRINRYESRILESQKAKRPKEYDASDFDPEKIPLDKFCLVYKSILDEIGFVDESEADEHKVEFNLENFDVVINGNSRSSNGKGVKAILHAVFKIAILVHCRNEKLFHPGIVLIDSPLVTYRDPLDEDNKHGPLAEDEIRLSQTSIKDNLLAYLEKISHLGQFIFVENITIQNSNLIEVETFYGRSNRQSTRRGFLQ